MIVFDKAEVRSALSIENIYELLHEWGGDPEYSNFGILSRTICHNEPGEGSKKLYYYANSDLFKCYTACDESFDIFQLVMKVARIQFHKNYDLNDAVRWIAKKFNISGYYEATEENEDQLEDWKYLDNYDRIQDINIITQSVVLKEYDNEILTRFNYSAKLTPWLKEGISQKAIDDNGIGFFPGEDQIIIPHYDQNNRLIGIRGRTLIAEEGERYGKYRPIYVNKTWYNHPLGMNLYNLNNSQNNIHIAGKAIIFEGEKSCLLYQTYFGRENDISVACCGSSVTNYQIQLLLDAGAKEIIIAYDRQFQKLGDDEYLKLKKKYLNIYNRFKNYVNLTFILDNKMTLSYKASPVDEGKEKFLQLYKTRVSM